MVAERAKSQPDMTSAATLHRSRIEIMFSRLKDWCRLVTRYDRDPTTFFSAVTLAATTIFRLMIKEP
jgi:transposase